MTDTIAQLSVDVTADTRSVEAALARVEAQLRKADSTKVGNLAAPFTQAVPAIDKAERSTLAFAQARARLLRDQGNLAGSERVLQGALAGTTSSTTQTIGAQRQLLAVQKQIAGEGVSGFTALSSAAKNLNATLGAVGIGLGIQQVVQFGSEAVSAANDLEDLKTSLRVIAGDGATYAKVMAMAAQNQRLFGGSLGSNIEDLTAFVVSSRTAGVEMSTLVDVSKRLASFDVGQGLRGANVAIRELLSGNPRSLVSRFELPAAAVKVMGDESLSATQKLAALGQFLDSVGITSESITAKLDNTSQTYRDLGAAIDNAKTALGGFLAEAMKPAAQGAANIANTVASGVSSTQTVGDKNLQMNATIVADATSYEDYTRRVAAATQLADQAMKDAYKGDPIGEWVARLTGAAPVVAQLSERQFALAQSAANAGMAWTDATSIVAGLSDAQMRYAQGLIAQGTAANVAAQQAQAYGAVIDNVNAVQGRLWDEASLSSGALQQLNGDMATLAGGTDATRASLEGVTQQYLDGAIGATELYNRVGELAVGYQEQAAGAQTAADATQASAQASYADVVAKLDQEAAAAQVARQHDDLKRAVLDAAASSGSAADMARIIANQYMGVEAPAILKLIELYRSLNASRGQGGGAIKQFAGGLKGAGEATQSARLLAASYNAGPLGTKAKGAGGGSKVDQEAKDREALYSKLLNIQETYESSAAKAEETYQDKILKIQQEYAAKQLENQRQLAADSVASRADFYDSLINSDVPPQIQQQLSAAYEQAFADAQAMAQTGNAAMADSYLQFKEKQLGAEEKYQASLAEAQKKAAEGSGDERKQAEEQIQRLEAIKKLRDAQYATEEAQIRAQGGTDTAQRDQALAEAANQRQQDLADASAKAGDALSQAQQKSAKDVTITNEQLQKQLDLVRQLGGGAPAPGTTPTGGTSAAPAATQAIPTKPAEGTSAGDLLGVLTQIAGLLGGVPGLGGKIDSVRGAVDGLSTRAAVGV